MKLYQDIHNPCVVITYSHWESQEKLDNYRESEEFIEIWPVYPKTEIEILTKGVGDNTSSKYSLYKFKTDEGDVSFYLAGGG